MWPVNWPGENQKGKSGGSLSWNSAWILGAEGAQLGAGPPHLPQSLGPRLCVGDRAGQGARRVWGREKARASKHRPSPGPGSHAAFGSLA